MNVICSISNSFRDMSNSLNSPVSHVVKITSQIPIYLQSENLFTMWKTAKKIKKHDFRSQNFQKKHIKNKRKFSIKIIVSAYQMPTAGAHKPTYPPFVVQRKPYTNERAKRASCRKNGKLATITKEYKAS